MRPLLFALLLLAACKSEEVAIPDPVTMNADALGHFCQMQLISHPGPKAQIHLKGLPDPIFFAQVRDALAYVKGPERDADLVAFYVSDMGQAPSWDSPGNDNWVEASKAEFVVGADVRGGMGAPEIVPFSDPEKATEFIAEKGGQLMSLEAIPAETVLSPVDVILNEGS
ncbi:nitrous oxide reductase accessory protein NosL [uncultured Roseovarius sp.]|uniref:nitrous oxide reductase accessory protein NosL n=1 Tax=uncultured Roseovarius sp. TaxID=293344 RepID=UPI00260AA98B|nr:nitrous oxide reductase accessory protein NosL [uncultured Roseovarius sp.]